MSHEEDRVISSLADLCKAHEIACLVQVGAEDGYEADRIRSVTGCRAVAIEPDPQCSPCSARLKWYTYIIGATDCVVDFYLHETAGLSSQIPRKDGKEIKVCHRQYRLDSFCSLYEFTPDALLIDTEGTTLDVLEGCGSLLDNVKIVYAEVQSSVIRPGMRLLPEVDTFLAVRGFTQHQGAPSYSAGAQGNYTWVRSTTSI